MLILERQEKIIEYLKAHKSEKTAALARAMYVSEATVRRDIAEMEKLGLVRRSHGAWCSSKTATTSRPSPYA